MGRTNGPKNFIFWMVVGLDGGRLIFGILPNFAGETGASSKTIREYWQGVSEDGKVTNLEKVLGRSIAR